MAEPLISPFPRIGLEPGMQIVFEAVSPTTGATVAGVTVSEVRIYAGDAASGEETLDVSGPFMLVPGPHA